MSVQKFRKKPVVIEAIKWTGKNHEELSKFMNNYPQTNSEQALQIGTLEGVLWASKGDWIIRGIVGEFYPCKPYIFKKTYEPIITPKKKL